MRSGKRDRYHHCCIKVYSNDLNYHLQAAGVGCNVGGAWINSLSYAEDMVLLLTCTHGNCSSDTLGGIYAGSHDIVYNTTITVCIDGPTKAITVTGSVLNKSQARK